MLRNGLQFVVGSALIAVSASAAAPTPTVGQTAPPFSIKLFDGSKTTLADYRGKVLVINYWATWCGPCKAEMPMMSAFHRKHRDRGFEIVGVVTEDSVPKSQLTRVIAALSYPLASKLTGKYGIINNGVPTSYVIDRTGRIRYTKSGSFSTAEFSEVVLPLLDEPG